MKNFAIFRTLTWVWYFQFYTTFCSCITRTQN